MAIKNKINKISRSYTDTPENVISNMLTALGNTKNIVFKYADEEISFAANYWTPARIFKYLCDNYLTEEYSDFVFYETTRNFYFVPVSYLISQGIFDTLTFSEDQKLLTSYSKIKYFNQKSFANLITLATDGFMGKTLYKYNKTTYGYSKTSTTLTEAYEQFNTLGSGNPIDSSLNSAESNIVAGTKDTGVQNFARQSQKLYNFETRTNGDINRETGKIFSINFKTFDNESETNEFQSGKWLNHTIKHIIENDGTYEQNMRFTKNAFLNPGGKVSAISNKVFK